MNWFKKNMELIQIQMSFYLLPNSIPSDFCFEKGTVQVKLNAEKLLEFAKKGVIIKTKDGTVIDVKEIKERFKLK